MGRAQTQHPSRTDVDALLASGRVGTKLYGDWLSHARGDKCRCSRIRVSVLSQQRCNELAASSNTTK